MHICIYVYIYMCTHVYLCICVLVPTMSHILSCFFFLFALLAFSAGLVSPKLQLPLAALRASRASLTTS